MSNFALSLVSGLVGALAATFVTLLVGGSREKRRQRLAVFSEFVSNRHDITGDRFSAAMNGVLAGFADCPTVLRAHHELYSALQSGSNTDEANRRLIDLWRSMADSAGVGTKDITDAQFLRVMNPRG
ncbi:DUF6680 family protein [Candidatus Bipolaricaulota bacterium]